MIKQQWDKVSTKVNALSMRERVLVFATVTVVMLFLLNMLLLEPLMARQKALHSQISQQQQTMLEVQAQIAALVLENSPNANSPQRNQINQIRQEIAEGNAEGNAYLKSSREKLVQPEKMAEHLRQLLSKNNRLQLVSLQTLPATPLLEPAKVAASATQDKQVFKHGVNSRCAEIIWICCNT